MKNPQTPRPLPESEVPSRSGSVLEQDNDPEHKIKLTECSGWKDQSRIHHDHEAEIDNTSSSSVFIRKRKMSELFCRQSASQTSGSDQTEVLRNK